jgi:hypothetical protein
MAFLGLVLFCYSHAGMGDFWSMGFFWFLVYRGGGVVFCSRRNTPLYSPLYIQLEEETCAWQDQCITCFHFMPACLLGVPWGVLMCGWLVR